MTKRNRTDYKNKAGYYSQEELGVSGLNLMMGKVKEDVITALQGPKKIKTLEEMVNYDPTIGAFNNMYQSIASSVDWKIKPKDDSKKAKKIAEFINSVLFEDLDHPFQELIQNALTAPQYGFSIVEPVLKIRDGKKSKFDDGLIGLSKLAPRYQGSITKWLFDDSNRELIGVRQKDPNTFGEIDIPYSKLLHFKHRSLNGNPEGRSLYLNCVPSYLKKKWASLNEDIRYERGFDGILDISAPAEVLDPTTKNPQYIAIQNWMKDTAQNIRNGSNVAIARPKFIDVKILSAGEGNIPDADKMIERENKNIAIALLSDFFLTQQKSGNSAGFTTSKIKIFTNLVEEMLSEVCREINHKLIPDLVSRNLFDIKFAPTIDYTEISDLDMTNFMLFFQSFQKGPLPATLGMANVIQKRILGKDAPEITEKEFNDWLLRQEVQTVSNDDGTLGGDSAKTTGSEETKDNKDVSIKKTGDVNE